MGYTNFSKDRFSKDNFTKINFIKTGGRNMCDKFIGRKNELKSLETAYSKNSFQMCIVYGRRRIGKTTLINEFIRGKEHIAFTAIKGSAERNIELFGEVVVDYFMPGINGVRFTDIKDILNFITNNIGDKKLVLVIDELPYLAEADKEFLSLLQVEIDKNWLNKNIFLILSGSSISFMEQEVLSSKSPIYGRRTMQIDLKPFNYLETALFVPDYSCEEKAICYGITGGIAKYISMFDSDKSLDDNIANLYFNPSGFMYEEPRNLLVQEFRNAPVYDDVVSAIANGANKAVEIKDKTNLESASVHNILQHLLETRIIEKTYAITEENNKKKVMYSLSDGMFMFWHKFIPRAVAAIEIDNGKQYYLSQVKPKLHEYMGEIFEKMCRQYLLMNAFSNKFSCTVLQAGKWFGTNPAKKEQTDIDVVGLDTTENKAILGECKFRNTPMDKKQLEELMYRDGLIDKRYKVAEYHLYSLSGFTDWVKDNAVALNVRLIPIEDMYN